MRDIKNDLEKLNINIETPAHESNPTQNRLEEGKWGSFLNNKTFTQFKNNFILLKNNLSKLIVKLEDKFSEINTNYSSVNNTLESHTRKIEDIERNGTGIKEQDLVDYVNKKKENTLEENLNVKKNVDLKTLSLEHNNIVELQGDTINIGNSGKSINIIGKDTKLLYNGTEIQGGSSGGGAGGSSGLRLESRPANYYIEPTTYGTSSLDSSYPTGDNLYIDFSWSKSRNPIQNLSETKNVLSKDTVFSTVHSNNVSSDFLMINLETLDEFLKEKVLQLSDSENILDEKELTGFSFDIRIFLTEQGSSGRPINIIDTDYISHTYTFQNNNIPAIDLTQKEVDLGTIDLSKKDLKIDGASPYRIDSYIDYFNISMKLGVGNKEYNKQRHNRNSNSSISISNLPKTIKDNYNSGNYSYRVVILLRKVQKLYLTNSGGSIGGSGGSSVVNISSQLGLPVIAKIPTGSSSGNSITIPKERYNNRVISTEDIQAFRDKRVSIEYDSTNRNIALQKGLGEFKGYSVYGVTKNEHIIALNGMNIFELIENTQGIKNIPLNKLKNLTLDVVFTVYGYKTFDINNPYVDIKKENAETLLRTINKSIVITFLSGVNNIGDLKSNYINKFILFDKDSLYDPLDDKGWYKVTYVPYADVSIPTKYSSGGKIVTKDTTHYLVFTGMEDFMTRYEGIKIEYNFTNINLEVVI